MGRFGMNAQAKKIAATQSREEDTITFSSLPTLDSIIEDIGGHHVWSIAAEEIARVAKTLPLVKSDEDAARDSRQTSITGLFLVVGVVSYVIKLCLTPVTHVLFARKL